MKRLEQKVAVVYGNGTIGSTIAKAFAKEGAEVYLAGRTISKMKAIADEILSGDGDIKIDEVDALNEKAVEKHMNNIISKSGKIDISFNAIGIPQTGIQGIALINLPLESFSKAINTYTQSHFITSKAAARQMVKQRNGVILMHTPNASRISEPFIGGMPPAWAALEALCRSLSVECGPHGVRSVCLLTTGIPETPLIDEVFELHGKAHGTSYEEMKSALENRTHRKCLTTLNELANAAVFAVSDESSAITGTIINLTAGMIVE